jgi:gas vesicle protein
MSDNKKPSLFGLGVVIGTVIGAVSAFFLSPTTGEENREVAAKKIKQLKKLLQEHELDTKIKEIFGEVTEEAKAFYFKAKDELIKDLADLREKIEEIDKEKYLAIVDDLSREMKKEAKFTGKVIDKLHDHLVEDWEKIKQ